MSHRVALIGHGEAGRILAADLPATLRVWDTDPAALAPAGTLAAADAAAAVQGADVTVSAVTAAQTVAAATAAAPGVGDGAWFLDLNSASPAMKREAADVIGAAGGRYVEGAVMSPLAPRRLATAILLGGPDAEGFLPVATALGLTGATVFSATLGQAAAAKMCRSVMVKGVEALLTEALVTARHYGVEETVVGSLTDLFPGPDWRELSQYMIARALEHGARRAEEMREVAATVGDAGVAPLMSTACAERQDLSGTCGVAADQPDLAAMLDALGAALARRDDAAC